MRTWSPRAFVSEALGRKPQKRTVSKLVQSTDFLNSMNACWMSQGSRLYSRNLRASPYATNKKNRWGDERQWWFVVFFRGRVLFEFMPVGWEQTGAGMSFFIARLPGILRKHLRDGLLPRVVFSDRGPGFYQGSTGHIVKT